MAKKVFMISPFEVLTGNVSGKQDLRYPTKQNKAYNAPAGTNYATNYHPRFIVSRRGKDGLAYFAVKRASASVKNGKTMMAMALVAATSAIISACKKAALTASYSWDKITLAYLADLAAGRLPEGVDNVNKFANFYIRQMLQYKQPGWARTGATALTINNPFNLSDNRALEIAPAVWSKFCEVLMFNSSSRVAAIAFSADSRVFHVMPDSDFYSVVDVENPNAVIYYSDFTKSENAILFKGLSLYDEAGTAVEAGDDIVAGTAYTTIAPIA